MSDTGFAEVGDRLTSRELEVLAVYARVGLRKEVGALLGITTHSVQCHLSSAYRKLGVNDGIAAFHAIGWLSVPPNATEVGKAAMIEDTRVVEIKLRHLRRQVDQLLEIVA